MKSKGVRIQGVFLMFLITILITGCTAPKKVSEASGDAKKTVEIDTSGDSVKVGILHSLSGTMAISEVSVHDAELLAIHEINQKGGVLGKKLEPVVEDGASDWPTYAEKNEKAASAGQSGGCIRRVDISEPQGDAPGCGAK